MNKRLGMNIYMLRKSKGMTQDDLADVLNVSKMAVSKWERGVNFPDIEIMCIIADYFDISVDELLGRKECLKTLNGEKIECLQMAKKIIKYAELAREEGLLTVEKEVKEGEKDEFLAFVVETAMDGLRKSYDLEKIENILTAYVEKEENQDCAKLCVSGSLMIISGVYIEDIKEEMAIRLGKEYRKCIMGEKKEEEEMDYVEILKRKCKVDLIEGILKTEKENIWKCIGNIDNVTLAMALSGASGEVCVYVLNLLDKQLRWYIYEDICSYDEANLEDIYNAQLHMKKLLECLIV